MGKTITTVLISYDVNKNHTDVKKAMKTKGYHEAWNYEGQPSKNLPNTTLFHASKSTDQALADLKQVCVLSNSLLEKAVAVQASEFVGI